MTDSSTRGTWRFPAICLLLLAGLMALPARAGQWGLTVGEPRDGAGALVTAVAAGGSAEQAGVQAGDLITHAEGRKVLKAGDLATLLRSLAPGQAVTLTVSRQGWEKNVSLQPGIAMAPSLPPAADYPPPGVPLKASIAVGDFQVKAAQANQYIGDGLREMLVTSLHNSGRFIVVERIDIKGVAAEQALSRSSMARPDMAIPEAQMEVADILIYGAVTEFEGHAKGGDFQFGLPGVPLSAGHEGKNSHMAIDMRVVDVRSGRLLLARRITSQADAAKSSLSAAPSVHGQSLPFSFSSFRNTPMEQAIREAVVQATQYVADSLPPDYFRHP